MAGGMLASSAGSLGSCLWGLVRHSIALTALRALHAPRRRAEGGERTGSLTVVFPWDFPGSEQSQGEGEGSVVPGGRVCSANGGGLQGGDDWQRIPGYLLLLPSLLLSVVPAALEIIEDEVRSPKAVSRPRLVGGQEGGRWDRRRRRRRRSRRCSWQLLSSWPGYLVLGAGSSVESDQYHYLARCCL